MPFIKKHPCLKFFLPLSLFLLVTIFFLIFSQRTSQAFQKRISEKVIRFHVIANSDSYRDQVLKGMVREEVLSFLQPKLENASTIEAARNILLENRKNVKTHTEAFLRRHSFYGPVTVSLKQTVFPVKVYGEFSFPAGSYEAYQIQIGNASGKNWWCVLYPSLCLTNDSICPQTSPLKKAEDYYTSSAFPAKHVSSTAAIKLKNSLEEEDFEALCASEETTVTYRSRIWDFICGLF